ncbi:phosphatase PAP2 family protein [bacterium]|nr:phosphatase PAP2 family protein [bacterium]
MWFEFINYFGDNIYRAGAVVLLFTGYLFHKYYRRQAILTFLTLLSLPYSVVLKLFFQHQRPDNLLHIYTSFTDYYSFPSTHTVFYTAFWGFVLYLCYKLGRLDKLLRIVVGSTALAFMLLVGVSRVMVGAHWVKDVVGGYFFGGIFLVFLILLNKGLDYPRVEDQNQNN